MVRLFAYSMFVAALALVGTTLTARAGGCPQGTVWREAVRCDYVCVSPATRSQVWNDNKTNPSETCPTGLVWREATPMDHICVDPKTRSQTWYDNAHAVRDTVTACSSGTMEYRPIHIRPKTNVTAPAPAPAPVAPAPAPGPVRRSYGNDNEGEAVP